MELEGKVAVLELANHPKNDYLFDDIAGDGWDDLLQSIRTSGITNAITITQDKVIISGHQRVRACKVLGIEEVSYKMIEYTDEKKQVKDLIESNLKQRVVGNPNPIKLGRCFDFLRDYYGIREGSAGKRSLEPNNSALKNEDLANTYNVSVDTMENYIKLSKAIPEVATLVATGKITKTTALALMKNLSEQEQEELITTLDITKKYTQKQIQEYIDKLEEKDSTINVKSEEINNLSEKITKMNTLEIEIDELKHELDDRPEKEIEVAPFDYNTTKKELADYKNDYKRLNDEHTKKIKELQDLKKQIELEKQQTPQVQFNKKLKDSTLLFCSKVATFIEQVGGYIWLTEYINELPELEKTGYIKAINEIKNWADTMNYNINDKLKEIK